MTIPTKPVALSEKWSRYLVDTPETGMGYQIATIVRDDGRIFDQVVIDSGYITRARGYKEIPFSEPDIAEIKVTHDKWNWNEGS